MGVNGLLDSSAGSYVKVVLKFSLALEMLEVSRCSGGF